MVDLDHFDVNCVSNPHNNIFGLPFSQEESRLVLLPVPWEVTVSYGAGTARAPEHIFKAALQVDLYDEDGKESWKQGIHMLPVDRKILLKSDYLRKEAELYIDYIANGEDLQKNKFMCKSLKEINEGSKLLNQWVFENTKCILDKGKLVGLIGGDHSSSFGFIKALATKHEKFGILQIDAHSDLRKAYENFAYSHASVMYNVMEEISAVTKLVQVGVRDYCAEEVEYVKHHRNRITTFYDKSIKERQYEGETWKSIVEDIIRQLPELVYISFDVDGLDPKLCPNTGTPVLGGFEACQIFYLLQKLVESGRKLIGFDLVEVGFVAETEWDSNVGARLLWKLCNKLINSNTL